MDPLFKATAGRAKKDSITWTDAMQAAFKHTKDALASATLLVHPHPSAPTALTTDASNNGIGAVLEQFISGSWQPLSFFSKALSLAESKYSAFDRELLAVHTAIRHFRYFLEGRLFTVYTDHKPLTTALSKTTDPHNARQSRHLAAIAEFTADIQHVAGKANPVADALSRVHPPITAAQIATCAWPPPINAEIDQGFFSPNLQPPPPASSQVAPLSLPPERPAPGSPPSISVAADLAALATAQELDESLQAFKTSYNGRSIWTSFSWNDELLFPKGGSTVVPLQDAAGWSPLLLLPGQHRASTHSTSSRHLDNPPPCLWLC